jgi:hypothetical protein
MTVGYFAAGVRFGNQGVGPFGWIVIIWLLSKINQLEPASGKF